MSKSIERMRELFANEDFKRKLLDIVSNEGLHEGAICPSGCGGTLILQTKSYFEHNWKFQEHELLTCKCGFQFKLKDKEDSG